jgi:hypothetical protein
MILIYFPLMKKEVEVGNYITIRKYVNFFVKGKLYKAKKKKRYK